jgi:hypothetical protein
MSVHLWQTSWKEQFADERDARFALTPNDLCHYGIKCLDDALCGIFKNDLVVIGADSGCGKSELVLNIARINAQKGKKVVLFYLEGGEMEAMRRLKWRDVVDTYFTQFKHEHLDMDYAKWVSNMIHDPKGILKTIEGIVFDKYDQLYRDNLYICPIMQDFGMAEFELCLGQFYQEFRTNDNKFFMGINADLILIDHLQYFSLPDGEQEITGITKILRHCKYLTDRLGKPIVLVSHLRKKGKDRGLPSQDDFYGSSNIPKISSTSITISPDYQGEDRTMDRYPTFFRIAKSRTGIRSNLGIRAVFDLKARKYEDKYDVYQLDQFDKPKENPLSEYDKPNWAKIKHTGFQPIWTDKD